MALSNITIYRDFPIKNGKVQIPPNRSLYQDIQDKDTALSLVPSASIITIAKNARGGDQEIFRFEYGTDVSDLS